MTAAHQDDGGRGTGQMASHAWAPCEFSGIWTPFDSRPNVNVHIECAYCRLPEDRHPTAHEAAMAREVGS